MRSQRPPEFSVVLADHQTAGRGQQSNGWTSEAGKNLTCSFILYPRHSKPEQAFLLNMALALAVTDSVVALTSGYSGLAPSIKWPNDILCADQKVAGILVENIWQGQRWDVAVVGIGLNLNQQHFSGLGAAASLGSLTQGTFDVMNALAVLQHAVKARYRQWETASEAVYQDYQALLWRRKLWSDFATADGDTIQLQLESVDRFGCACTLDEAGNRHSYPHGKIRQLR